MTIKELNELLKELNRLKRAYQSPYDEDGWLRINLPGKGTYKYRKVKKEDVDNRIDEIEAMEINNKTEQEPKYDLVCSRERVFKLILNYYKPELLDNFIKELEELGYKVNKVNDNLFIEISEPK